MPNSDLRSPKRKLSKANSKRKLKAIAAKVRPGLALDTSVGRQGGYAPRQIFPYETQISDNKSQLLVDKRPADRSIQEFVRGHLSLRETGFMPLREGPPYERQESSPKVSKKSKGLRPAPLQLDTGISPSDRAIPIGISFTSASLATGDGLGPTPWPGSRHSTPATQESFFNGGVTPTIIITPAREDFGFSRSPELYSKGHRFRPASSVYSRYTNGALNGLAISSGSTKAPPVPPLPLFSDSSNMSSSRLQDARGSATTVFEEHDKHRSTNADLSIYNGSDDDISIPPTSAGLHGAHYDDGKPITRQSNLPTPLRNKGWWNVITSPFSAQANSFFFRSPTINETAEGHHGTPAMLEKTKSMGISNPLFGRIFNGRKDGDEELRSAPPDHVDGFDAPEGNKITHHTPKRSLTAPSALDMHALQSVNIYRIPSQGEAASYYDPTKHFPSLIIPANQNTMIEEPRSVFSPDTPAATEYEALQRQVVDLEEEAALKSGVKDEDLEARLAALEARLVEMESNGNGGTASESPRHTRETSSLDIDQDNEDPFSDFDRDMAMQSKSDGLDAHADDAHTSTSPFDDKHAELEPVPRDETAAHSHAIFATPSPAELENYTPPMPPPAISSPLSPSPVVEHAHLAQVVGPVSANGGQREVDITPTRTPVHSTGYMGYGLGEATMNSQTGAKSRDLLCPEPESQSQDPRPSMHSRNSSYGLGISGDERSLNNSEALLFPPTNQERPISEKFILSTDRFRQLTVRSLDDPESSPQPWYKRFFWLLLASAVLLFLLMIVLLVALTPQRHNDIPIQATWMNLTGFPALPTGVATVIAPKKVKQADDCAQSGLWSCDIQSAASSSSKTKRKDQPDTSPNFRFEIRYNEDAVSNSTSLVPLTKRSGLGGGASAHATAYARTAHVQARSYWSNYLFSALPSKPSDEDQLFLGRTTDNISEPYDGLETPFYISLLDAVALVSAASPSKRARRSEAVTTKDSFEYPYPNSGDGGNAASSIPFSISSSISVSTATSTSGSTSSTSTSPMKSSSTQSQTSTSYQSSSVKQVPTAGPTLIPKPQLTSNGKPKSPVFYPYPSAQPLRLYNQGQDDEHYGFYNYFDRSILLSSADIFANSSTSSGSGGGSAYCTFSQTRLHVQIWTRKGTIATVASSTNGSYLSTTAAAGTSANDMTSPGSFPYPVTVTVDRHGGKADEKGLYCYGVDDDGFVVQSSKIWVNEDRAAGGTVLNPAGVPAPSTLESRDIYSSERTEKRSESDTSKNDSDASGGVDGGSGGCSCAWSTG